MKINIKPINKSEIPKNINSENENDDMVNLGKFTPSSNKKPKNSINKITNIDKKNKKKFNRNKWLY